MRLILMGAPGSGKGTQSDLLVEKYNIAHISTGDIFRANIKNNTELGKEAKEYIDKGMLVPDELTLKILKDALFKDECRNGFILDGFPRNIKQAQYLDKVLVEENIKIDAVLNIVVEDEEVITRISGRRMCSKCFKGYHIKNMPSKDKDLCDVCASDIIQRDDDKEETIRKRLETYHEQTEPLIEFYSNKGILISVEGTGTIKNTQDELQQSINQKVLGV